MIPLCRFHHSKLDSPGWSSKRFEASYNIDMKELALEFARQSPALQRYRAKQKKDAAR